MKIPVPTIVLQFVSILYYPAISSSPVEPVVPIIPLSHPLIKLEIESPGKNITTHNCDITSFVPFENHEPEALNRLYLVIVMAKKIRTPGTFKFKVYRKVLITNELEVIVNCTEFIPNSTFIC